MAGVVKDLLVCHMKSHGVAQGLTGTEVAGVTRVGAAGDDHAYAVPLAVPVSSGPKFDMYVVDPIAQGVRMMRAHPEVTIADVCALALRIDVTKDKKKISVFEAGAKE